MRVPPCRQRAIVIEDDAVEGLGIVRQNGRRQVVSVRDLAQMAQIRGRNDRRQNVHGSGLGSALRGQRFHQRTHHGVKALDVPVLEAGSRGRDHRQMGAALFIVTTEESSHIFSDGLGQTGGGHGDKRRLVLPDHIVEGAVQIGFAAEHRLRFAKARRGHVHGFAEVADEIAADVGRAQPCAPWSKGTVSRTPALARAAPRGAHRVHGFTVASPEVEWTALGSVAQLTGHRLCFRRHCPGRFARHQGPDGDSWPWRGSRARRPRTLETGERDLALVVVVAKAQAQLVGNGALFDPADEHVDVLLDKKVGQARARWCHRR
jgi:hypothetical protein